MHTHNNVQLINVHSAAENLLFTEDRSVYVLHDAYILYYNLQST